MASKNPVGDAIPNKQEPDRESWGEWGGRHYSQQKESWMPWIEDQYLRWFTKDNKASYATKDTLGKSKITGNEQIDNLQDGVNNLAAGQVGKGGLLQPVGDMASKEGVNRAERQGKDDSGSYAPGKMGEVANPVADGAKGAGNSIVEGGKSAGGYVSGMFGGSKK